MNDRNMMNIKHPSKCSLGLLVLLIFLGAVLIFTHNVQEQRSSELKKDILELQDDIKKLENEDDTEDSQEKLEPKDDTQDSQGKLEKDKLLGLKKDVATLKKESFASQDAPWLLLFQTLGTVGVVGGLWVTWNGQSIERENNKKTFEDAEKRLISDRFFNAVELLGSEGCSSQLGGIYTLESIANNCKNYRIGVIRILSGYIKDKSPYPNRNTSKSAEVEDEPTELNIEIALGIIQKIWEKLQKEPQEENLSSSGILDLNCTYWSHFDFPLNKSWQCLEMENSSLKEVSFLGSNLTLACFAKSKLTGVKFEDATLNKASFEGTHLERIKFNSAEVTSTDFAKATLKGVNFTKATLKEVSFDNAELDNVVFEKAILEAVNFKRVKSLKGANFRGATLQGVVFKEAHRQEADFSGVDLTNVTFEPDDCEDASETNEREMPGVIEDDFQSEDCSKSGDLWQKMRALLTRASAVSTSGTHLS